MRLITTTINSEKGHGGYGLAGTLIVVGTAVLAIGLGNDSNAASVIGALVLGGGAFVGIAAPHYWLRSVYRRLDKVDPEDHEAMPEKRIRIQF